MAKKKADDAALEGGNVASSEGAAEGASVVDSKATIAGFWAFVGRDENGSERSDVVAADTVEDARAVLSDMGLEVVSIEEYVDPVFAPTTYVWARVKRDAGEGKQVDLILRTHASKTKQYRG